MGQKPQLRQLYRSQQVHHALGSEMIQYNLPALICIAEFLLITSIYTVVRQFRSNHPFVLLVIGSVGFTAFTYLRMGLKTGSEIAKSSEKYMELKSMDSALPHVNFSSHDRKFFRSCQPIKIKVADSFTIEGESFMRIMNNIVITTVINLLVAF